MGGDLDWDGLRWFLAAASSGTLAGAARELGVEHTTVGRRLAALGEKLLPLRRSHPELSLEIVSGARPVDLKKGEADLAIRSGPVTDPDLVARKLGPSGWSLYAAPAYLERHPRPIDPDNLGGHDLIGYDPSLSGVPAARWIEERLTPKVLVSRDFSLVYRREATVSKAVRAVIQFVRDVMREHAAEMAGTMS